MGLLCFRTRAPRGRTAQRSRISTTTGATAIVSSSSALTLGGDVFCASSTHSVRETNLMHLLAVKLWYLHIRLGFVETRKDFDGKLLK